MLELGYKLYFLLKALRLRSGYYTYILPHLKIKRHNEHNKVICLLGTQKSRFASYLSMTVKFNRSVRAESKMALCEKWPSLRLM